MATEGTQDLSVFQLIWSDYQAHCDFKRAHPHLKGESARMSALKAPIRMIINSSIRGNILVRCTCASPRAFHWFWRSMLLTFHSSEVVHGAQIGPRLNLPHPFCIGIGSNVRIGTGVTICQYTTIGGDLNSHDQPTIGDDVVILAGAGLY